MFIRFLNQDYAEEDELDVLKVFLIHLIHLLQRNPGSKNEWTFKHYKWGSYFSSIPKWQKNLLYFGVRLKGRIPKKFGHYFWMYSRIGIKPMSENECRGEPCVRPTNSNRFWTHVRGRMHLHSFSDIGLIPVFVWGRTQGSPLHSFADIGLTPVVVRWRTGRIPKKSVMLRV